MRLITPKKQADGLGGVNTGPHHWWLQRVTAVALIPLSLWLAFAVASHAGRDYASTKAWLSQPVTTLLLVLWLSVAVYHASLGLQVVLEDYIQHPLIRVATLVSIKLVLTLLGTLSVVSCLRVAFAA
jgi:succinate dehydrogenase / fumarate reductase membrane anchor subunit